MLGGGGWGSENVEVGEVFVKIVDGRWLFMMGGMLGLRNSIVIGN